MSIINFDNLYKLIEERGVINVDEYLEAVQTTKDGLNKQSDELTKYANKLLRTIRMVGEDDDFYKSVENEITNISGQIDHALNNLNVMERKLNEMKGESNNNALVQRLKELEPFDTEVSNLFNQLNETFEGAPESIKGINEFNEQR